MKLQDVPDNIRMQAAYQYFTLDEWKMIALSLKHLGGAPANVVLAKCPSAAQ